MLLAHSSLELRGLGRNKSNIVPAQAYSDHVVNVRSNCIAELEDAKKYLSPAYVPVLKRILKLVSTYHDFGKLDSQCQRILNTGPFSENSEKMINHVWAGASYMFSKYKEYDDLQYFIAGYLILSHHLGFGNFSDFKEIIDSGFRPTINYDLDLLADTSLLEKYNGDTCWFPDGSKTVKDHVAENMDVYVEKHESVCGAFEHVPVNQSIVKKLISFVPMRFMLSILVYSDHKDLASHYHSSFSTRRVDLRPLERKALYEKRLDDLLSSNTESLNNTEKLRQDTRVRFRKEVDDFDYSVDFWIATMNGTVGSGKTYTSAIAALNTCIEKGLRSIIYQVPYIALVDKNYSDLCDLLTISNSDMEVNIIHSMADYSSGYRRMYAKNLCAPISVMTSVSLIDIFIGNRLSSVRNFHKLAGSCIVFDEYDRAANPEHWGVLNSLLSDMKSFFKTHSILCSGSECEFWELPHLRDDTGINELEDAVSLISEDLYRDMLAIEKKRVRFDLSLLNSNLIFEELAEKVLSCDGDSFVIFNTVKKTTAFCNYLDERSDCEVFARHGGMSFTLRKKSYDDMLESKSKGGGTILVATEGCDVGLDLSFKWGFKEASSYSSLLQMAGRINRHYEYEYGTLFVFSLNSHPLEKEVKFHNNPLLIPGTTVYKQSLNFVSDHSPSHCTFMVGRELENRIRYGRDDVARKIFDFRNDYEGLNFEKLSKEFKIIDGDSKQILINLGVADRIKLGEDVSYQEIQRECVNRNLSDRIYDKLIESGKLITMDDYARGELADHGENFIKKHSKWHVWLGDQDSKQGIMADKIWFN